jgi:uncharacterized repeat protein (TIGR01451 family)
VADTLPASITSAAWTCTASGGAACPSASGSGNLNQTLATLPAGGVVIYTITGTVGTNPPAMIANTATANVAGGVCTDASGTPTGVAMPCPATATNPSLPVFSITKTANTTAALAPGGQVDYTITATNTGAATATNVTVADTLPAGGVVIYTITGTVGTNPPAMIANTATANVSGGVCTDASGTPTGVAMPCPATATNPSLPVFSITKTANTTAALAPGGQVVYTITATNTGAATATNVTVADTLPAGIASASWTCTGSGAVCLNASGSGSLNETLASLPAGSSVTYVITATLATTGLPASITNVASVISPDGGLCQDGSTLPCETGPVSNPVTVPLNTSTTPVPALDARALAALMLLLAGAAGVSRRNERKRGR